MYKHILSIVNMPICLTKISSGKHLNVCAPCQLPSRLIQLSCTLAWKLFCWTWAPIRRWAMSTSWSTIVTHCLVLPFWSRDNTNHTGRVWLCIGCHRNRMATPLNVSCIKPLYLHINIHFIWPSFSDHKSHGYEQSYYTYHWQLLQRYHRSRSHSGLQRSDFDTLCALLISMTSTSKERVQNSVK